MQGNEESTSISIATAKVQCFFRYFNKHAELIAGEPNKPAHLGRNTFGGSFGGPIKKDRLYFFLAYEGQRTRENSQQLPQMPSQTLREGILMYQCDDPTQCPGGTQQVQGVGANFAPQTYSVNVPQGFQALGAPQIAGMDSCTAAACPWGPGVNPNVITTLNQYPLPNTNQGANSDGVNYQGFTFSSPAPQKLEYLCGEIWLQHYAERNTAHFRATWITERQYCARTMVPRPASAGSRHE